MDRIYYRPIAQTDAAARPAGAATLAGGWCWFDRVEALTRGRPGRIVGLDAVPDAVMVRLCAPRATMAGLRFDAPTIMAVLNVTPDSFSDGGRFDAPEAALARARDLAAAGADILDIGGESTRPGAAEVPVSSEIARVAPVIAALRSGGFATPVSVDTRKARVAAAALDAGADLLNDVSAMEFDADMAALAARTGAPICLMHAQGLPETMQRDPRYDDVLLDVYDYLEARIEAALAAGIARDRIMVDPGVGFGKTVAHNLALIRGLSLFHGLGCPILLGVSRKGFIGRIGGAETPAERAPGTLAVTLAGLDQGAQTHRVHDAAEIAQGVRLWKALKMGDARQ